jgi:hypothetical protein
METVQIVAIVVAAVGIVVIAYLLRERLTRLAVKFGKGSVEVDAAPPRGASAPPALAGKGVALGETSVKDSDIRVTDSTLAAQKSKVKRSTIEVTEHPAQDADD